MKYFIKCIMNKYADFSGRARRAEYWFCLFYSFIVQTILLFIIEIVLGCLFSNSGDSDNTTFGLASIIAQCLVGLPFFIPGIAVSVRRLHDIGKSGWYFWLVLFPVIGGLILLYFYCCGGDPQTNRYGPNPKDGY